MINISTARKKDASKWSEKEWHKVDVEHYGKSVTYSHYGFRFKAEENGKILGLITGDVENGVLYITYIITAEEARRRGVGTLMMKRAEEFGRKHGAHIMWLVTGKNWLENKFYQKVGFQLLATIPNLNFHKDFVVYTKEIK